MKEVLIVDGYNIIGAWPELRSLRDENLEASRDRLIELLAEYQAYSGKKVYLVFDAYQVPGLGKKYHRRKLEILYTKEKETADELIERLVATLQNRTTLIQVATSDSIEQSVTFGMGALRVSSRELFIQVNQLQQEIHKKLSYIEQHNDRGKNRFANQLSQDLKKKLEKWRRGEPDE